MEHLLVPYHACRHIPASRVLVIAPHADDEVFGCGGAIIRHIQTNIPVQVVVVTDGAYGVADNDRPALIETRKNESRKAAQILGYGEPIFWGLKDREVVYSELLIAKFIAAIENADLVYAPSIYEIHPDHRVIGMVAVEAVRRIDKPVNIALYEVGMPFRPNTLLDISDIAEQKMSAMTCFVSQNAKQRYDQDIAALNRYRSYTLPSEVSAAEAYILLRSDELNSDPFKIYHSEYQRQRELGLSLDISSMPLVSVIIRSIERPTLDQALDSVALQTYPNIEVIVVNAKGIQHRELQPWCGRFPLRLIGIGEQLTRSRAANLGLDSAQGDYLIFLDDDDWFKPEHISRLTGYIIDHPEFNVVYSGVECIDSQGNTLPESFAQPFDKNHLIATNYIPIHAALFSKQLLTKGCRVDESLELYEDWDFWIQASQFSEFKFIEGFSAVYRIGQDSGFGVNFNQQEAEQGSLIIYHKWFPRLEDKQLLKITNIVHTYKNVTLQINELHNDIANLWQAIKEKDGVIAHKDNDLSNLWQAIKEKDAAITQRDNDIANLWQAIKEKDAAITQRDNDIANLWQAIRDKDEKIAVYTHDWHSRKKLIQQFSHLCLKHQ